MSKPFTSAKGAATRDVILARAVALARLHGLDGLTIGALADDVGMSKSGLFAHFGSREELQLAALEVNGAQFLERVLAPALEKPRGLARLRAMMANWFEWIRRDKTRGVADIDALQAWIAGAPVRQVPGSTGVTITGAK